MHFSAFVSWINVFTPTIIIMSATKVGDWLDGILNDEGKAAVSRWLKGVPPVAQRSSWPVAFSRLIDKVFGSRPLSIEFILKSFAASVLAATLVWLFYLRFQLKTGVPLSSFNFYEIGIVSLVAILVPDYISLLISRAIIRLIAARPRPLYILLLLIVDAFITLMIALVSTLVAYLAMNFLGAALRLSSEIGLPAAFRLSLLTSIFEFRYSLSHSAFDLSAHGTGGIGAFVFSAFFTSLWLWGFILSGYSIKVLRRMQFVWNHLAHYLDVEKSPLGCICRIGGILLACLWLLVICAEKLAT